MNKNFLAAKLKLKGMLVRDFIKQLGISKKAWYRKINGKTDFTRTEINKMICLLDISDEEVMIIFFGRKVS